MAGTIFGLPLSQRVDLNGKPSAGWLLYTYQANSTTRMDTFKDTALTPALVHPWPLAADAYGMMPAFWMADGSYHMRGTNADGSIVYFDMPSVLALGPSSGATPTGGVDPNAIFQTGDVIWLDRQGARTGWVRDNGLTIGNSTSGAQQLASTTDAQALYEFLWNNFPQTICAVTGGRGANALADFNNVPNGKAIATPDKRGYIIGGLDDMGNAAAGRLAGVPLVFPTPSGTVTTPGAVFGEATHTLLLTEAPAHNHTFTGNALANHDHGNPLNTASQYAAGGGPQPTISAPGTYTVATYRTESVSAGTPSGTIDSKGGGGSHNTVQKTVLGTFYRKL